MSEQRIELHDTVFKLVAKVHAGLKVILIANDGLFTNLKQSTGGATAGFKGVISPVSGLGFDGEKIVELAILAGVGESAARCDGAVLNQIGVDFSGKARA